MKTVLITGSTRGIGKAMATKFASSGYQVILHASKDSEMAQATLKEIKSLTSKVSLFFADITSNDEVVRFSDKVIKQYVFIDVLINNAGITKDRSFQKMTFEEWDTVIQTNLYGTFRITHSLLPYINESGRIINISSVIAQTGGFGQVNYSSSKSALIGFTKSLALELSKKKITVNALCPGFTLTEMTKKIPKDILELRILPKIPLGRLADPMEIAELAFFLSTDKAAYITGQAIGVNGGLF